MTGTAYVYEKKPRSVSQINQFEKCGYAYKLARIDREWKRPAAWLYQGTAVHEVAEHYMRRRLGYEDRLGYDAELGYAGIAPMTREDAYELFGQAYADAVNEAADPDRGGTPNLGWWFRSGMYDGYEDIPRRFEIGREQVDKLIDWIESHPEEEIWVAPDGKPGIELKIDVEIGGVQVIGYIDAVIVVEVEPGVFELRIRDYKTGNKPGDDFQLAVYAVALKLMYGIDITVGEYWMAGKKGKKAFATYPFDLTEWPEEKVAARFAELEADLEAGNFEPKPSPDTCMFCDVALACTFSMA